jgi:ATP-binding cassette subfamily B protein
MDATVPRRNKAKTDRIPDLEWMFGYGESKQEKENKFLHKLIRRDWRKILYTTLLYIIQCSPAWVLPLVTSDVIDTLTYMPDGYVTRFIMDGAILLFFLILNVPMTIWRSAVQNKWTRSTTAEVKSGVMRKLQRLSITYHKEMQEGKIQSKLLRDVESFSGYLNTLLNGLMPNICGLVVSSIIAFTKSPMVSLFFVALVPCNVLTVRIFHKKIRTNIRNFRIENESLSATLTTSLQMLTVSKAHGLAATEMHNIDKKIDSTTQAGLRLDKTYSFFGSASWVMSQVFSATCLFICVALTLNGYITVGNVVLFQSLFSSISGSLLNLINSFPALSTGKEAVRSLSEIICATDIERDNGVMPLPVIRGEIKFDNVCYHYPDDEKPVVKDFTLNVKQGERIAVVGSSGSGKSTLMNLIIGLLSPTSGEIIVDGVPLSQMPMQSYRKYLSVVPQNSILFSGTLKENITYGLSSYSEEELERVVKDACIDEFLPTLPDGINSQVGERGEKLSGGQKQRLSIARALIRNPSILILDEATSALDNLSEYHVQKAIDKLLHERTTFIVAHRLSTIRNADRIVVMEDGQMVELGTYDELMQLNGKFAELEKLSRIREEEAQKLGA